MCFIGCGKGSSSGWMEMITDRNSHSKNRMKNTKNSKCPREKKFF